MNRNNKCTGMYMSFVENRKERKLFVIEKAVQHLKSPKKNPF